MVGARHRRPRRGHANGTAETLPQLLGFFWRSRHQPKLRNHFAPGPDLGHQRFPLEHVGVPMAGGDFTTVLLNQKMRFGPVILGYYEPEVSGNHVVVAYGASETHVAVMNPDGARFIGLPVGHYSQSSEIILGIPTR